ncbi:MAG: sensor histidine kinase [Chloroflexota bacterium]
MEADNTALSRLWVRLVDFTPDTTDITIRTKSTLFNKTLLIAFAALTSALLLNIFQDLNYAGTAHPQEYAAVALMMGLLLVSWTLNRRNHFLRAARLLILGGVPSIVLMSLNLPIGLVYMMAIMLLSAIFIPDREAVLWIGGIFLVVLGYAVLNINEQMVVTVFFPIFFYLVTLPLLITYMLHVRRLERERLASLEIANRQLQESERVLEQRVIERTQELEQARHEAIEARDQALEADRMKSQFLASMSHELRTPLNSILTFTELMAMGTFGDVNDEQKDYLQKTLFSGRHLLSLINDVLDITKIHSGMMKLFIEDDFNVATELDAIIASAEKMLGDRPIQLVADIDPHIPPLTCDKRRVRQVILNLVSNAVKFTEEGVITVSAKVRPDDVLFAIIDTGPGISQDQQEIIFEPFIQTETGIRHAGGTGLGLPISRRLIDVHGGSLWLESQPGEGAAFFFTIPLKLIETASKPKKEMAL